MRRHFYSLAYLNFVIPEARRIRRVPRWCACAWMTSILGCRPNLQIRGEREKKFAATQPQVSATHYRLWMEGTIIYEGGISIPGLLF